MSFRQIFNLTMILSEIIESPYDGQEAPRLRENGFGSAEEMLDWAKPIQRKLKQW